jgi:hypothetical protein
MRAFVRVTNFDIDGTSLRLQASGYTWDGSSAPTSTGAIFVPLEVDDNEYDVNAKVVEAAAAALSMDKSDITLVS